MAGTSGKLTAFLLHGFLIRPLELKQHLPGILLFAAMIFEIKFYDQIYFYCICQQIGEDVCRMVLIVIAYLNNQCELFHAFSLFFISNV